MFIETPASKKSLAFRKPVFGRGIIDVNYVTHTKQGTCPYFIRWRNIFDRCYNEKRTARNLSYVDCEVCEGWYSFKSFRDWMEKQDWEGKHIDKDIINPKSKIYSPENCIFIDPKLNMFLSNLHKYKGYQERRGKFAVQMTVNGKNNHLGTFLTKEEAIFCYKENKRKLIQDWADKCKYDKRLYDALIRLKDSL